MTTNEAGTRHAWLDALPEGGGLLFTITSGAPEESEIAVVGFRDGEVRTLRPGTMARYASSSHIVYLAANSTLLAAPFDLGRLEVTGPPIGLLEGVDVYGGSASQFALSETGTLLYVSGGAILPVNPVWVGRDGTAREIHPGWSIPGIQGFSSLALSPDGTSLAVSILEGTIDIRVKQLDTGPLSRLTFEGLDNFSATWSPDGLSLVFASDRAGDVNLWTKRAYGSNVAELLLDREAQVWEGTYSPDGTWLVFREGTSSASGGDIYAIRPGVDSVAVPLAVTEFEESAISLSPDGLWLAYVSDESGGNEVFVRRFPDATSPVWQVSTSGGTEPLWANSGEELFDINAANELVAVQVTTGATLATVGEEVLFSVADYLRGVGHPLYDVSPDDQRFVMLRTSVDAPVARVTWVQNWFEVLRERVGN